VARQYGLPPQSTLAEPPPERGKSHYRKMREPFAAELKDPTTRRLLAGIISAENPGAKSAVAESLMNRTAMVNEQRAAQGKPPLKLKDMIQGHPDIGGGKSFYGPVRTGAINDHMTRLDRDPNYAATLNSHIDAALGGADTIRGHTDQGSANDPNYIKGGIGVNINGERFNDWGYGGSRAWREQQQKLADADEPLDPTPNVGAGASAYAPAATGDYKPADTSVSTADAAAAVSPNKKKTYQDAAGDEMAALGDLFSKGPVAKNAARASGPTTIAPPVLPTTPGVQPVANTQAADAQRQQLAAILQRLNSGRLV
jgi:hypothetical protein